MSISNFYYGLPRRKKPSFREKVNRVCGWSYGTFYYKLSHNNLSRLERKAIKEIILSYQ
jgi:hypothetical protein